MNEFSEGGSRRVDLISRREDVQVNALRKMYEDQLRNSSERSARKVKRAKSFANIGIPTLVIFFVSLHWIIGLQAAYGDYMDQ